ncbi:unnamed protein product [Oikopleura dioica]|uniref:Uncharacterized protein n=1 Tax=Oikopleura dioica TaxID=34765 RepID=E4YMA8_OIKDI|nr:unnamed protein product [Oikopleura dioica]
MTKSNSHFGVACGIFIMIFVSGYFSIINQEETSFKNTEYMQKRDIELEATRTNSSDFLSARNDERVRILQKGCSLDQNGLIQPKTFHFEADLRTFV